MFHLPVGGSGPGAGAAAFALLFAIIIAASAAAFSVVRGPAAFFQQPICLQPHAWDFLRAAGLKLELELLLAVLYRPANVPAGSRPVNLRSRIVRLTF